MSERNGSVEVEEGERERRAMGGPGGFQKLKNLGEGSNEGIILRGLKFGDFSPENLNQASGFS